jgi:hypothetical protein
MTPKAEQLIARQETYAKFPFLIKVTHPLFDSPLYYANSNTNIVYDDGTGEQTYEAAYFSIDPPDKDGSKIGDAQLTISAVDQFWIEKIRSTQIAAKITFIAAIQYDDGTISGVEPIEEMEFTLRVVNWNENVITWAMVFDERQRILVPCDKVTALKCPGAA